MWNGDVSSLDSMESSLDFGVYFTFHFLSLLAQSFSEQTAPGKNSQQ